MHIALISPNFPPEKGACAERVHHLATYLHAKGHQVLVITALPNYPQGKIFETYQNKFFYTENLHNILICRCWLYASNAANLLVRGWSMLSFALSIFRALPVLWRFKPDLVFVQSPPLLLALSAWVLAKLTKAKFWFNISDLFPQTLLDLGAIRKGFVFGMLQSIAHFLYKKANYLTGQSEEIITYLHSFLGLPKQDFLNLLSLQDLESVEKPDFPSFKNLESLNYANYPILYRTGVDCQLFEPITKKTPTAKQPFRLVYAGLLGVAQGVLQLCKHFNFKELGIELHIFGEGLEQVTLATFLEQEQQNGNNRGVFLHSAVSQKELSQLLPTFDAALVLQKATIFGTVPSKLYEAAACGLPVLFVGGGEGANLVQTHNLGLVATPQNWEELRRQLLNLRKQWANNAVDNQAHSRNIALQFFERQGIVDKVYEQIIK